MIPNAKEINWMSEFFLAQFLIVLFSSILIYYVNEVGPPKPAWMIYGAIVLSTLIAMIVVAYLIFALNRRGSLKYAPRDVL